MESPHFPKKGQVNHCFQAAFHLLRLLAGRLQLILDQALWPNLPLRLPYGSKLKWLCAVLEQITSGIYGYSQLPLTGRMGEASIVLTHNVIMIKEIWTDVRLLSVGINHIYL